VGDVWCGDEKLLTIDNMGTDAKLRVDICRKMGFSKEGFGDTIEERVRKDLGDLLKQFSEEKQHISRHSKFDCMIKWKAHNGWKQYRPRKLSDGEKKAVKEFVKDMLSKNYIQPIISPYVSNILLQET
jgi:hypothetical protein